MEVINKDIEQSLDPKLQEQQLGQARIQTYVQAATQPNTRRAYRSDLEHYRAWVGP